MPGQHLRGFGKPGLATLCGAIVAVSFCAASLKAIQPKPSGSHTDFPTIGPTSIEKSGQGGWQAHLSPEYNLLAVDENRRGTLRERIRERRENRANERSRENDGDAAQDSNSRIAGRRINAERVRSWIAELRETIGEQIGGSAENRSFQPYPGLEGMPLFRRSDAINPAISPITPLPAPNVSSAKPGALPAQDGWRVANPSDVETPGPELVAPELSRPEAPVGEPKKFIPPNSVSQVAESPEAATTADRTVQAQDAQLNPAAADNDANSQGQQPSKPSGLSGLFSNVTKMFGATGSNEQETAKLSESQEDLRSPSQRQPEAQAASRSDTKSPPTIRKTLGEIRKQILLKQSQGQSQTQVGN